MCFLSKIQTAREKKVQILTTKFRQGAIDVSRRLIGGIFSFVKSAYNSSFSGFERSYFCLLAKKHIFVKPASYMSRGKFCAIMNFRQISFYLFGFMAVNFWKGCQNFILQIRKEAMTISLYFGKLLCCPIIFGLMADLFPQCCQN